jgi:hypothetical protein
MVASRRNATFRPSHGVAQDWRPCHRDQSEKCTPEEHVSTYLHPAVWSPPPIEPFPCLGVRATPPCQSPMGAAFVIRPRMPGDRQRHFLHAACRRVLRYSRFVLHLLIFLYARCAACVHLPHDSRRGLIVSHVQSRRGALTAA